TSGLQKYIYYASVLAEMESFSYLGSILNHHGGTDADVRSRIGKARAAFHQLKNTWGSREISTTTKIMLHY
ncbi:hypothetical protein BgiMline_032629, partial [Biomphalaria glabrata]